MIKKSQFQTAEQIIRLGNAVTWIKNQKTQFMNLTATQSEAIRYILKNYEEKEITAADLMANLHLSQSTVAGIIQRLVKKGLIDKKTDTNDGRKNIIIPTGKGVELENRLKQTAVATEEIIVKGMSNEEQKEFNRLLQIALDNTGKIREKG